MKITNHTDIKEVDSFLRLYGEVLQQRYGEIEKAVDILPLDEEDNDYGDIIVRLGNRIFISKSRVGELGLTIPELYAAIAHELGHIFYHTAPWDVDAETRADTLAAELGLGNQMINVIDKIICSRRYRHITSQLVQRIQFLRHLA